MKKILSLVLVFILSLCLSVPTFAKIPETISKSDREELNRMVDVFGVCVATDVSPNMDKAPIEEIVMKGFYECQNEAEAVLKKLQELGLNGAEINNEFTAMYLQFIQIVRDFMEDNQIKNNEATL